MNIGLISCSKNKKNMPCLAFEMYSSSALFNHSLSFCQKNYHTSFILSAKYGLLNINEKISPYDLTLNDFSEQERLTWGEKVFSQLKNLKLNKENFYILAGKKYIEPLEKKINIVNVLYGMGIGERLKFLKDNL